MKQEFQVGYAQVNINPMMGIGMEGYYIPRYAKGFLDDLEASALALSLGEETVLLVSVDTCLIETYLCDRYRERIQEATGISKDKVFLSATHTHTGPFLAHTDRFEVDDNLIGSYADFLEDRLADLAKLALAGTVLQVYDKVEYVPVDKLRVLHKVVDLPANVPNPEDMPRARLYKRLHEEGRDGEIPYTAMELTTVVAEAFRMCELEHGPDSFPLDLTGVQIGPVALIGIPGEPFTEIGVGIKDTAGWSAILPCCLTNGSEGYFPLRSAFDEGGYEARKSKYKGGVAEAIINGSKALLDQLRTE